MDNHETDESSNSLTSEDVIDAKVMPERPESQNVAPDPIDIDSEDLDAAAAIDNSRLEIVIPHLPSEQRAEFKEVKSDIIERVIFCSDPKNQSSKYEVEFSDTRTDLLTLEELIRLENDQMRLRQYMESYASSSSRKRKYEASYDTGSENINSPGRMATDSDSGTASAVLSDSEAANSALSDDGPIRSKRLRTLPKKNMNLKTLSSSSAQRQTEVQYRNYDSDNDEDGEESFLPATMPNRRTRGHPRRRGRLSRSSHHASRITQDESLDNVRRSSRRTKSSFQLDSDDGIMDAASPKAPVPNVISIKEVFKPIPKESLFRQVHMQVCHTCGSSSLESQIVYCQGCCLAYHKNCIGVRNGREHLATKIGEDDFVFQCKYCIASYFKKDTLAPRHSHCQSCKVEGSSCAAFSAKKTPRQEEQLREENGGVDPITSVADEKVNNDKTVLCRCDTCHRAWHQDHLPSAGDSTGASNRNSLSNGWRCDDCEDSARKIHRLVCWRPATPLEETKPLLYAEISDDDREYLIKWEGQSYAHCSWMPGAWVFGIAAPKMKTTFAKRAIGTDLCFLNQEDAIPKQFIQADIIFDVELKSGSKPIDSTDLSSISQALVKFQGLGYDDVVWDSPPAFTNGPVYDSFNDAYREYVTGRDFKHVPTTTLRERVKAFRKSEFATLTKQPEGIQRGKLMGYQMEGLNWLLENYHQGRSVVLADEMGLGKTVQVISLILTLIQQSPLCWPFLVVVPNATCPNWRREFKQWTPSLRVVTYHGGRQPQDLAYKYELFPDNSAHMKAHVVIMSYDSAQDPRTATLFKSVPWAGLVVDEGQRLKNDGNLLYLALAAMKIPFRLLLTGTPLQNNKRELFNLIQFIDSSQNAEKLDEEYSVLDKDTLPRLHEQIRPYFLRRTKLGVLKFLPAMAQIIVPVTMTVIQEELSKSIMSKNPQLIKSIFADSKMKSNEKGSLNNILMQLRKCLCHPFMYSQAIEEVHHDQAVLHRNLVEASSKLLLLEIMLPKLKERGHRILIFSQFLQQLDIIEDFFFGMKYEYRRLDGKMSSLEKQQRIDEFNAPSSSIFAFLLSTRAGGVGINLATADTVIIMDPDFNPHQDMQALSRAHRIGQKHKVLCFQLVTKDSVEERIMEIGRKKLALDHALIESMDDGEIEGADLESILKHGAQALFNDDYQKSAIQYDSASVEKLLDRSQAEQEQPVNEGTSEAQFCFPRVWANEKNGFDDNLELPDDEAMEQSSSGVWEKILAQREEDARLEAEANREELGRGNRRRQVINYGAKDFGEFLQNDKVDAESDGDEFEADDQPESESDADRIVLSPKDMQAITEGIAQTKQNGSLPIRHRYKSQKTGPATGMSFLEFLRQSAAAADASGDSSEDELSRAPQQDQLTSVPSLPLQHTVIRSNKWYTGSRSLGGFGVMRRRLPLANRDINPQSAYPLSLQGHIDPFQSRYSFSRQLAPITTTQSEESFMSRLEYIKTEAQARVAIDMLQRSGLSMAVKHDRISALHFMLRQVGQEIISPDV